MKSRKLRKEPEQLSLALNTHGGKRAGAGRPRKADSGMPHLRRTPLAKRYPVHVTTRLVRLPSLRGRACFRVVRQAIGAGAERAEFRVVEFSVQSNHIHMICEAGGREALARGLQGLFSRLARALNRLLGRTGQVFADRYHDRILRSALQVRNALAYVLNNARRHAAQRGRRFSATYIDPCSSGPAFYGVGRNPVTLPRAHTWLLGVGWKDAGQVQLSEVPGGAAVRTRRHGPPTGAESRRRRRRR